ncbi:hypothetical protein LSTR_LSTR001352 [Laodelphax striatellus]|uniref:Uncharacterized protein n=1 Tax=Laodelphax striatellus TaxID=195883 RepID=A0A482XFW2_LAOST|nr:hypothetical protein LSTR_LSTR001352 [Laodelphax striatellus]
MKRTPEPLYPINNKQLYAARRGAAQLKGDDGSDSDEATTGVCVDDELPLKRSWWRAHEPPVNRLVTQSTTGLCAVRLSLNT